MVLGGDLMANIKLKGFEDYERIIWNLEQNTEDIVASSIYEGAKVVADAVKIQINGIRSDGPSEYEKRRRLIQIRGLKESMGISSMRNDNGFINVKIGFDGYNELGQPNVMIARVFESGTSFSSKQPFFKRAINQSRKTCETKMKLEIDKQIKAITEGEKK